jgi:hypothetical protein
MTLKPEFHFLEVAYPYVARWAGCDFGSACSMVFSAAAQCARLHLFWGSNLSARCVSTDLNVNTAVCCCRCSLRLLLSAGAC